MSPLLSKMFQGIDQGAKGVLLMGKKISWHSWHCPYNKNIKDLRSQHINLWFALEQIWSRELIKILTHNCMKMVRFRNSVRGH
jgi:hypothetical protein